MFRTRWPWHKQTSEGLSGPANRSSCRGTSSTPPSLPPMLRGRRTGTSRRWLACRTSALGRSLSSIAVVSLLLVAPAVGAVKPKPWAWTSSGAAAQLNLFEEIDGARCVGKGKAVTKRFLAFCCTATLDVPAILWVKVRPVGKGEPCWGTSLATVPAACLNPKGVRVREGKNTPDEEVQLKIGGPGGLYQGNVDCVPWGLGYYECAVGDGGKATVTLLRTGAVVRIIQEPAA